MSLYCFYCDRFLNNALSLLLYSYRNWLNFFYLNYFFLLFYFEFYLFIFDKILKFKSIWFKIHFIANENWKLTTLNEKNLNVLSPSDETIWYLMSSQCIYRILGYSFLLSIKLHSTFQKLQNFMKSNATSVWISLNLLFNRE